MALGASHTHAFKAVYGNYSLDIVVHILTACLMILYSSYFCMCACTRSVLLLIFDNAMMFAFN